MAEKTLVSAKGAASVRERKAPAVRVARPPVVIPPAPKAAYQIDDPAGRRAYTAARRLGLSRSSAAWASRNRHDLAAPGLVALASAGVVALVWWLASAPASARPR